MNRRDPQPSKTPEHCKKCGGEGFVKDGVNFKECPRCEGTGIEPDGVSQGEQTAIGALGGGAIGYSLGGPAGALIGGLIGAALSQQEEDEENHESQY
jgi:hypothetical protein